MKLCIALILILHAQALLSQKVHPEVLSSGGDHIVAGDLSLDWTLGELSVETIGGDPILTQGFHQGNLHVSTAVVSPGITGSLTVYPVPTGSLIHIRSEDLYYSDIRLLDIRGRVLYQAGAEVSTIDLAGFTPGIYFFQLWHGTDLVATAKIQKF